MRCTKSSELKLFLLFLSLTHGHILEGWEGGGRGGLFHLSLPFFATLPPNQERLLLHIPASLASDWVLLDFISLIEFSLKKSHFSFVSSYRITFRSVPCQNTETLQTQFESFVIIRVGYNLRTSVLSFFRVLANTLCNVK
jgi:hypothetical protein